MKCIYNGRILYQNQVLTDKVVLFTDKIEEIADADKVMGKGYDYIDAKSCYVAPGFIDLHIHGYGGIDTMDAQDEGLLQIAKGLAQNGVTAFLPTTMSMSKAAIINALEAIRRAKIKQVTGAQIIGAHLEGPYFNPDYKGAQDEKYMCLPSQDEIDFVKDYQDVIKHITLSPELEGALHFIENISKDTSISLAMGHTAATYEEALKGIRAGISHATHLFNAMRPLHHREPGAVGAALTSALSCEMICDTIHLREELFSLVIKAKGLDKVVLVTDCMCAGGCKAGEYALGGQKVIVDEISARLESGALAGSILKLNAALRNIMKSAGVPIQEAIRFVTINPANVIGIAHQKGSLEPGKDADITLFDDNINVQLTIGKGKTIYESTKA